MSSLADEILIRPVRDEADVPAFKALVEAIYADYGCVLDLENLDRHLDAPGQHFRALAGECWVAIRTADARLVATGAVVLHADAGEIRQIYVDRSMRRRGLGRRMTMLGIDYARAAGRERVFLWSDTRFVDAHKMYAKMGFVQTGETRFMNDINNVHEYQFVLNPTPGASAAPAGPAGA